MLSDATRKAARLGYLVGIGWPAKRIAAELEMTPDAVYRYVRDCELSFRSSTEERRLSEAFEKRLDDAAVRRRVSSSDVFERLTSEIARCPYLLENILDDGVFAATDGVTPS